MQRFCAIEGLRGWLVWAVVFAHLGLVSGVQDKLPEYALPHMGHPAVLIFIIISGFVITHLTTTRPEPYGKYLVRRFMRIFPLFAVTCLIGFFTTDIHALTLSRVSYAGDPSFTADTLVADIARSNHEHFWSHLLAHVTMMHGAITSSVLPFSLYAFNSPAWSLSVEWQFYLVAPFAIALVRRYQPIVCATVLVAISETAYRCGLLGQFEQRSFLPIAAGYFAIGITSRVALPAIAEVIRQVPVLALAALISTAAMSMFAASALPMFIWTIVLVGMAMGCTTDKELPFARVFKLALESRIITYFGSRSYSLYLCHMPIIALCHSLWLLHFPQTLPRATLLGISALSIPVSLVVAELLYRGVEQPGITLGTRLTNRRKTAAAAT